MWPRPNIHLFTNVLNGQNLLCDKLFVGGWRHIFRYRNDDAICRLRFRLVAPASYVLLNSRALCFVVALLERPLGFRLRVSVLG